jgi:hypothetical protein
MVALAQPVSQQKYATGVARIGLCDNGTPTAYLAFEGGHHGFHQSEKFLVVSGRRR